MALPAPDTQCVLTLPEGGRICDLTAYGEGTLPAQVQVWEPPCEQADFLVFSTHADDEILFLGGVLVTYAGERLLAHCRKLTLWSRQVEDELKDISDEEAGEIHIGVTAKRGLNTIPAVFPAFHEEYPKIEVHLHEGNSSEILRDLEEETTDMAIVVSEIDSPDASSPALLILMPDEIFSSVFPLAFVFFLRVPSVLTAGILLFPTSFILFLSFGRHP